MCFPDVGSRSKTERRILKAIRGYYHDVGNIKNGS
jgi:hypothetical protein